MHFLCKFFSNVCFCTQLQSNDFIYKKRIDFFKIVVFMTGAFASLTQWNIDLSRFNAAFIILEPNPSYQNTTLTSKYVTVVINLLQQVL